MSDSPLTTPAQRPAHSPRGTPVNAPRGTRHRVRPRKKLPVSSSKRTEAQLAAIREELKLLPDLIKQKYTKWTHGATDFQLQCMGAQALGQDTVLHAYTGAGKTGIAAGPHLLPSSAGKVTLVISPLLSLHEEQVTTFKEEFGLKAIAINSAHGGCTKELLQTVVRGDHQIVLLSPEMLLSRRFIDNVLRKPEFGTRCLSVFIDEAHCVSHWGASFRKKYGSIGIIRAFLPCATPIMAVSATLTARVHDDILAKLQINPKTYLYINVGNDRPGVAQVVRAMQHPMNSFRDADFLVDESMLPSDVPKAFVYSDDTKDGAGLTDHLNNRVHPDYRARGLVRPYNASMSKEYRELVMQLFRAGIVRILVCTDAAGMMSTLSVQWKMPANMSAWVQRAGRAARGRGRQGLAVMLVEKTAFEADPTGVAAADVPPAQTQSAPRGRGGARGRGRGRGGRGRGRGAKRGKDYAVLHGQKRGSFSGADDEILRQPEPPIPVDAPAEGLYLYIQATSCRRAILAAIFGNKPSTCDSSKCCDLCNPALFDQTRPSRPLAAPRQQAAKKGVAVASVRQSLYDWRREIKKTRYRHTAFAPQAILDDDACERLASIGPISSKDSLAQHPSGWARWDLLGDELFSFMQNLDIPPLESTRKRPRAADSSSTAAAHPPKRTHTMPSADMHYPVLPQPTAASPFPVSSTPTSLRRTSNTGRPTVNAFPGPSTPGTPSITNYTVFTPAVPRVLGISLSLPESTPESAYHIPAAATPLCPGKGSAQTYVEKFEELADEADYTGILAIIKFRAGLNAGIHTAIAAWMSAAVSHNSNILFDRELHEANPWMHAVPRFATSHAPPAQTHTTPRGKGCAAIGRHTSAQTDARSANPMATGSAHLFP
ncbi:P-loop containing nucleoside triphosphate hydrolase protein [Mycena rebaudengoi]|nr:P-loop containing nucleoside triphosphate hydrolase protein [Mycena rebaudengoi]